MKKILSLFAALIVALTANAQFAGGKGTAEDPYQIADAYQLADMQNYPSSHFKLINDIDLTEWIEDNSPTLGWSPIGSSSAPFTGDFDGNGFSIRGLKINRSQQNYVGLFGYVSTSQNIKNVNIQNPIVTGGKWSSVICGYAKANLISNCNIMGSGELFGASFTGSVCGEAICKVQNCKSILSEINSTGGYIGGIVGLASSHEPISNCYTEIKKLHYSFPLELTGVTHVTYCGGIVGNSNCGLYDNIAIINSLSSSTIGELMETAYVGGIVGQLRYNNSYAAYYVQNNFSIIAQEKASAYEIGGIIGRIVASENKNYYIYNNYSYSNISGSKTGGIVGNSYSESRPYIHIKNCLSDGNLSGSTVSGMANYSNYNQTIENTMVLCPNIIGTDVNGISEGPCKNSVCITDLIKGTHSAYRISKSASSTSNKALISTKVILNGEELDILDDANNGTAFGDKTLKRSSTYVGLGWDMVNTWKINEGEDYPYLRMLSDHPTITKYESTNNCKLTGTSPVNGKIYVMKDGATYTSDIVDNAFEINVGAVNVGDTLLYFSMPESGKPSMVRRIIIEGTTDPSCDVVKGDANGDSVVDAADVVSTVNSILGKPSSTFVQKNADINEDGQILVDDAVGIVNIIMNAQ